MGNARYQACMHETTFTDGLNHWLATQDCAPAEAAAGGTVRFDTRDGSSLAARQLPDGRVELFCTLGYVGPQTLRMVIEDPDEDAVPPDEPGLVPLLAWQDEQADWQIEVRLVDGLAVLARIAEAPLLAHEWEPCVEAIGRECEVWAAKLPAGQSAFDGVALREAGEMPVPGFPSADWLCI